jgi:hypothetical protein
MGSTGFLVPMNSMKHRRRPAAIRERLDAGMAKVELKD